MIVPIDITIGSVADAVVRVQRAAYAVEAELIGDDRIPPLSETSADVRRLTHLTWRGAIADESLIGVIAWVMDFDALSIDRLAVDPSHERQGHGARLLSQVPSAAVVKVSTGAANAPARRFYEAAGFDFIRRREVVPGLEIVEYRRQP